MRSFRNDICIHDLIFIEEQHTFIIVAPGETLNVEFLSFEGKRTLHYDSIAPEKDLIGGTGNTEGVFLTTPFSHTDL